jgi:DIM1 family U5 snRNP protein
MAYMLPHLHNGWQVDQAIISEEDKVVVIRFGHDWDPTCMKMDEVSVFFLIYFKRYNNGY